MSGKKAAAVVEATLADAADLVITRLDAFLSCPDDIETNHKFRVSIRTLRGLVAFLEPWQKPKQSKRVQRKLKKVVKATSRLRELDVLAELGKKLRPDDVELIAFLESEAASERTRVHEVLSDGKTRSKIRSVADDLHAVAWKHDFDAHEVRLRFDDLVDGLQADLDNLDIDDYELVHSVRKRAKQVRYVAEKLNPVLGDDVVAIAKHMKSQQDHLGALCDANVNRTLIEGFLTRENLSPTLAASLSELA